ncbi:hypothetical protein DFH07DRAFT_974061 [Mycena maculata]|uniref:Uncharacterized protein n=1 Tax=Mycena maculata TaxID=230809 RepID=A0AAD7HAI3_9AGAR|nr:hypothetical protein DFH07DRAFT_974061 [Mycena maculata]
MPALTRTRSLTPSAPTPQWRRGSPQARFSGRLETLRNAGLILVVSSSQVPHLQSPLNLEAPSQSSALTLCAALPALCLGLGVVPVRCHVVCTVVPHPPHPSLTLQAFFVDVVSRRRHVISGVSDLYLNLRSSPSWTSTTLPPWRRLDVPRSLSDSPASHIFMCRSIAAPMPPPYEFVTEKQNGPRHDIRLPARASTVGPPALRTRYAATMPPFPPPVYVDRPPILSFARHAIVRRRGRLDHGLALDSRAGMGFKIARRRCSSLLPAHDARAVLCASPAGNTPAPDAGDTPGVLATIMLGALEASRNTGANPRHILLPNSPPGIASQHQATLPMLFLNPPRCSSCPPHKAGRRFRPMIPSASFSDQHPPHLDAVCVFGRCRCWSLPRHHASIASTLLAHFSFTSSSGVVHASCVPILPPSRHFAWGQLVGTSFILVVLTIFGSSRTIHLRATIALVPLPTSLSLSSFRFKMSKRRCESRAREALKSLSSCGSSEAAKTWPNVSGAADIPRPERLTRTTLCAQSTGQGM